MLVYRLLDINYNRKRSIHFRFIIIYFVKNPFSKDFVLLSMFISILIGTWITCIYGRCKVTDIFLSGMYKVNFVNVLVWYLIWMGFHEHFLALFRGEGGSKKDLIATAKSIAESSEEVTRLAKKLAAECTDKQMRKVRLHYRLVSCLMLCFVILDFDKMLDCWLQWLDRKVWLLCFLVNQRTMYDKTVP